MTGYGDGIFPQHAKLLAASAISPEVAQQRAYRSVDTKSMLESIDIPKTHRLVPGLLIPVYGPESRDGEAATWQYRPDYPRIDAKGRPVKYVTAMRGMVLDIPPAVRPHIGDPSRPLWITEGIRKVDSAVSAGIDCLGVLGVWNWRGTNNAGGKAALPAWDDIALNDRDLYVCFDSDVMVKDSVRKALDRFVGWLEYRKATVRLVVLPDLGDGKTGLDDYLAAGGTVADLEADGRIIWPSELSALREAGAGGGVSETYDDIPDEPGWQVLDDVRDWLAAHVAYSSSHHAPVVALWCAHTHALDRAASTPRIAFESPEPESGKTRNLELMECVCHRGKLVLQMSPASIYRWVEAIRPTILLDEVDAVFGPKASKDHEDLRTLVNAGHRPGAKVPRVETPSMRVVEFSCYCPVALAGLWGCLPDTIRSRSIRIPMRRRAPDEKVRPFRERITRPEGDALHRRLAAWVSRHGDDIPEAPVLPAGVTDRQADQWEPLVAVADAIGGHWPDTARAACTAIVTEARANVDDQSVGIRLLADIHTAFGGADRATTADLLAKLHALDEAPWSDWYGKPITARWLATKLKPYGVRPGDHRFEPGTRKGYLAGDFHEVWHRYDVMGNKGNKGNAPGRDVAHVADVAHTSPNDNGTHPAPTGGREELVL